MMSAQFHVGDPPVTALAIMKLTIATLRHSSTSTIAKVDAKNAYGIPASLAALPLYMRWCSLSLSGFRNKSDRARY